MRRLWLVLTMSIILGCNAFVITPTPIPTVTTVPSPLPTLQPTATAVPQVDTPTPTPLPPSLMIVRLRTSGGGLKDQLAEKASLARELGLMPVVEFEASW